MVHKLPKLAAIVAMSTNRVIGLNNQLPWHLPADLKHFKALTLGHTIIMGRNTYQSIGKPLPQRKNIVLTKNRAFTAPGCTIAHSLEEACQEVDLLAPCFIIGGEQLYQIALPFVMRIYLTCIDLHINGDTFFPELDMNEWKEIEHSQHMADEHNPHSYRFVTLERIKR